MEDTGMLRVLQRFDDMHMAIDFTFRTQGAHNQTELSNELAEHFAGHRISVPTHENDDQEIQFILCTYKRSRAPANRSGGYEHRITRDENASVDDWSLRTLRNRCPDVIYRGLPVVFVGSLHQLYCRYRT
jgi:hypothetical protein